MNTAIEKRTDSAQWSREQIDLIKNTCAKDSTDDEFKLFLHFCKESGVDPLRKQAHFVVRRSKNKQTGQWDRSTQMIVGIDGFRSRAEEQPDYLGIRSAAVYEGESIEVDFGKGVVAHKVNPLKRNKANVVGAWAMVHRKGRTPHVEWVDWSEYFDPNNFFHKSKPAVMCKKTAEATALRHEYPEKFSGMYAPEEMPSDCHIPELMQDEDEKPGRPESPPQIEVHPSYRKPEGDDSYGPIDEPKKETPAPKEGLESEHDLHPGMGEVDYSEEPTEHPDSFKDLEGAPRVAQNLAHEIRIQYGRVSGDIQKALKMKFTKQQLSDLLGLIMKKLDIPAEEYIEEDGLIHTKKMNTEEEGRERARKLIAYLQEESVQEHFKALAIEMLDARRPKPAPAENAPETAPDEVPDAPEYSIDDLRKRVREIQEAMNAEYGMGGLNLSIAILKKAGLTPGSELTLDKLKNALGDMTDYYTRLASGGDAKALILHLEKSNGNGK